MKKRNMIATSLAVVLAVALLAGGTYTYLIDSTDPVTNEFSTNQNGVELEETTEGYEIVPGTSQEKDPIITATYTLDSYVFVEVTDATDDLVTWYIENGWTLLSTTENNDGSTTYVYYQLLEYDEDAADEDGVCTATLHVLAGDQVYYSSDLTNDDLENAADISLTFQSYIIQADPFADAQNAWLVVSGQGEAVNETTGVVYATLAEALSAANSGDLVALLQNVTAESTITISKDVTLDLGGYTLTANLVVSSNTELTLTNGTIESSSGIGIDAESGSSLTLKNVDVEAAATAVYAVGANVTIDGGSVTSTNVEAVRAEGGSYVEISNSTVTAATNAVAAQNSEIIVSNSEISGGTSEYKVEGSGSITVINGSSTTTYDTSASYVVLDASSTETLATQLTSVLATATAEAPVAVVLPEDADVTVTANALQTAITGTAIVDLNGGELTVTSDSGTVTMTDGDKLTIANGTVTANNSTSATGAAFNIQSGSSITLENVTLTGDGSMLYPQGNAAEVNVINSTITTSGAYCVATNAATVDNYNVTINIKNSTLTASSSDGDNCAVLVNIPCTLSITDSTITGDRQGVIVRGGTATITDSTIINTGNFVSTDSGSTTNSTRLSGTWSSGNEVPSAALEVGNYSGSYNYVTNVTLSGVTLTVQSNTDVIPAIYAASYGYDTTLTGASDSNTVLARVNTGTVSINGASISTIEAMTTVGNLSTSSTDE